MSNPFAALEALSPEPVNQQDERGNPDQGVSVEETQETLHAHKKEIEALEARVATLETTNQFTIAQVKTLTDLWNRHVKTAGNSGTAPLPTTSGLSGQASTLSRKRAKETTPPSHTIAYVENSLDNHFIKKRC